MTTAAAAAEEAAATASGVRELPSSLRVVSLNCWGLKFLSQHRHARLAEIGRQIALASPTPHVVGLQECWTQQDYRAIRERTRHILPHGRFYWSGVFGAGLAILSQWPLEESRMCPYRLNGRPAAFFRGDWYVGKGVATARIRIGPGRHDVLEVFCTHLHAPYEPEPDDSYLCHRTAQAWDVATMMRHAAERGHLVLGLGDFNMVPGSLAHRLIEAHAPVRDVWRTVKPHSALGSYEVEAATAGGEPAGSCPTAAACLDEHGATCDSTLNTWRWSRPMRKRLDAGDDAVPAPDPHAPDAKAKRLDYIFFADNAAATTGPPWHVADVQVGMTMRHPTLRCSLSDHFSVEATLVRRPPAAGDARAAPPPRPLRLLPPSAYAAIQAMIAQYALRERTQRRYRIGHFFLQLALSAACLVAVWWSPANSVAFLLMLLSTLGLSAGVVDGLMGFLFVGSELRALREFQHEIDTAAARAHAVSSCERKAPDEHEAPASTCGEETRR